MRVVGDKSISHRALILAALADGVTEIEGLLQSADVLSTQAVLQAMGVQIITTGEYTSVTGRGSFENFTEPNGVLDAGNSGTTARLMAGLLAATPFFSVLSGDTSLRRRPMDRVTMPLRTMGATMDGREGGRFLPLAFRGRKLHGVTYELPIASAQVKSALLLAGLSAQGESRIVEPRPTRDHTERMMTAFGVEMSRDKERIALPGPQMLHTPGHLNIPGDFSAAAFFLTAAALVPDSEVTVEGVGINPGRIGLLEILSAMGGKWSVDRVRLSAGEPVGDVTVRYAPLRGVEVGPEQVPAAIDELPLFALLGASAHGISTLRGAEELRVKESDRIRTTLTLLRSLGVEVTELADGWAISGPQRIHGGCVETKGDHRIAMTAAIASLIGEGPVTIDDAASVDISFPTFFAVLEMLYKA
ncbi:MAG: 3-phosphoshikimate 1-carboxyvinyltransferase [Firmicutes bacterium]|nr:3-phosphoshikimate 1-carboxyvinyltransferase [Bacillota bacterium]